MNIREMENVELVSYLKELVKLQKKTEVALMEALQEVIRRRLHFMEGYSNLADYCRNEFGISADSAWKKSRAARVLMDFPQVMDLLKEGKTHLSHIALLGNTITMANADKIMEFLPGASKRDLQLFLFNLMPDGTIIDREPTIEIKLQCTKTVLEKLDRARKLFQLNCPGANDEETFEAALDAFLAKKDPHEKAKRAAARLAKKEASEQIEDSHTLASRAGNDNGSFNCPGAVERAVPAKVKYELFLKPQCDYVSPSGKRCEETNYLQIDHIHMKCRGGTNDRSNVRLLCAGHNLYEAERNLGKDFVEKKISVQEAMSWLRVSEAH